jgi:hydroxymethylglutaryl-CoA lyase
MHIHSKENGFTKIIDSCIDNNILKFDSSMCGIGGCPFAEDEAYGNISTTKLIRLLQSIGYCSNYNLNNMIYCEKELKKLLDL